MKNKALMTVLSMALIFTFFLPVAALASTEAEVPDGFDKYIVYSAAGRFDTSVAPKEGNLGMWFHKDIMGRNDMEIAEAKAEAVEYIEAQFGPNLPEPMPFGVDPRVEYRAYVISGESVPSEGYVVRDGGFMVMLQKATVLFGRYGGEQGKVVPAGTMIVYGTYNIDRSPTGKDPLIIQYRSASPVIQHPLEPGFKFDCVAISDEFGEGRAQGLAAHQMLEGGNVQQSNIRTVLTFPAYGPSIDHTDMN